MESEGRERKMNNEELYERIKGISEKIRELDRKIDRLERTIESMIESYNS